MFLTNTSPKSARFVLQVYLQQLQWISKAIQTKKKKQEESDETIWGNFSRHSCSIILFNATDIYTQQLANTNSYSPTKLSPFHSSEDVPKVAAI